MGTRHNLRHAVLSILKHNKDGSFSTQACRKERLIQLIDQLVDDGYKLRELRQLKTKHIQHLVDNWLKQGLSAGTIKNRLTDIRWLAEKIGKPDLIPNSNAALNIPKRQYVTNKDKSISLSEGDLSGITNHDVRMSLLLQRAFGLRREESIKIRINQAVIGDELHLKGAWTKNGRGRIIPIRTDEQREIIWRCQVYVGKTNRALIPPQKTYAQQLYTYEKQLQQAGINKAHGLRHAYAQQLYFDLTGWQCPAKGGPRRDEMNERQREQDIVARQEISRHLGHERLSVVSIYAGV